MPTDVIQVHRDRWTLRNAHRPVTAADLFRGQWGALTPADIVDGLDVEYDQTGGRIERVRRYPVLPPSTRQLLAQHGCRHPALALDKFAYRYADQNLAKGTLNDVVHVNEQLREDYQKDPQHWYRTRLGSWRQTVAGSGEGVVQFRCVTTGPLTMHLARASALENAGICLHPLYGFVYLPGSGLKGMARAYAETVWFSAQYAADATGKPLHETEAKKAAEAWHLIETVFGWAPNSDKGKPWKPRCIPAHGKHERDNSGQVVFHDAWPTEWPKLIVDIVNNHHADYYQKGEPPGDWENPVPVYFLAVERDTVFEFALGKRRDDVAEALLEHARQWLLGGLCHFGAGAKTNAGYGNFSPLEGSRANLTWHAHATFEATLELVTPAFLAGASQQADDCDLRPATVRGLLRWWWRTMHAGFVDVGTLQQMEAAVWGDTKGAGGVRTTVQRRRRIGPRECPGKRLGKNRKGQAVLEDDPDFVTQADLELAPKYTTQGLFYAAYGTDEMKTGDVNSRKRRWYLDAGSQWSVVLTARPWTYEEKDQRGQVVRRPSLPAALLLNQSKAALWLLCQFGGAGSKARKGFGSFADPENLTDWSWEKVVDTAEAFRQAWNSASLPYQAGRCDSLSLQRSDRLVVPTSWRNAWFALDQLGASRQAFAQAPKSSGHGKHCPNKVALGLPRRIHGPLSSPLAHQKDYTPPDALSGRMGDRFASPVFFHLAKQAHGGFAIRVLVFAAPRLWAVGYHDERSGPPAVEETHRRLLDHLKDDLSSRKKRLANRGHSQIDAGSPAQTAQPADRSNRVRVKVLAKHSLPNSFRVQEEGERKNPGILQFGKPPSTLPEPGQTIEVYRHNTDPRSPQFRWDPPPPPTQQRRGGPPRGRR